MKRLKTKHSSATAAASLCSAAAAFWAFGSGLHEAAVVFSLIAWVGIWVAAQ